MSSKRFCPFILGLVSLSLAAGAAHGADAEPTHPASQPDLQSQVNALNAEVQELKAQQDAGGSTASVSTPATQNAGTGLTGGWNPTLQQFYIGSADGSSYFHPGIIFQGRYDADWHRSPDKWTNGFELRRMKFYFDGWVFTPDLTYKFQWQDAQSGGSPTLEYGWAQYVLFHNVGAFGGDVGIKGGQTKNYAFKEQAIVADTQQLMVERSFLDSAIGGNASLFGGSLIEGVDVAYTGKKSPLHLDVMFNGGDGSGLSNYTDVTSSTALKNNFGAAARADYKVFGDWADNSDLTGKQAKHDFLDFGGGVDFSEGQTTAPVGRASSQSVRMEGDAQYTSANHFTLYGEYLADYVGADSTSKTTLHHRTDMGGLLQGGYFILPSVELVARYDFVDYDGDFKVGGRDLYQEAGAGVAWYLGHDGAWGNHAKVSADVNYLPNGTPAVTGLDYSASPSGHDAIVIRTQFQLWL